MNGLRQAGMTLAGLVVMAVALAQDEGSGAAPEAWDELDTVVIVGEQTPPMWKLTRKGHVLWILGSHWPQPRNFRLGSPQLDRIIAGSDEVIFPGPALVASVAISAMSEVVKSDRNPGGATLQQLMPADTYAKWLELRTKYSDVTGAAQTGPGFAWQGQQGKWVTLTQPYRGGDGIDSLRPTFAWEGLRRAAMNRHELVNYDIESSVSAIAKKHSVPVRKLKHGREFMFVLTSDPVLQDFALKKFDPAEVLAITDYGDLECLTSNLDLLEPVIEVRKIQASAWARGDMAAFRAADQGLRLRDCVAELVAAVSVARLPGSIDAKKAQDRYYRANRDSTREVQKGWMKAVQDAVKKNRVTFTMVPMTWLPGDEGYLAELRDKGFELEESGEVLAPE